LIYAASLELRGGNWGECYNKLSQLNIWQAISDADTTLSNLLKVVKERKNGLIKNLSDATLSATENASSPFH